MNIPITTPKRGEPNRYKKQRRFLLVKRDGAVCRDCGETDHKKLTVDHIIPRGMGGSDRLCNMQILCRKCHDKKDNVDHRKAGDNFLEKIYNYIRRE